MTNNDTTNDTTAEYIPTDDHMRSLFCQGYAQGDFDKHDQAWAAWEKWLTAHDARVKAGADARLKAVEDVLRRGPYEDARGNAAVRADEIRRALDA